MSVLAIRKLGSLSTSLLGYGCMGLSEFYGTPLPKEQTIAVIRAAFAAGVTHFDTADMYGCGENEQVLGEAIAPFRNAISIATKCGIVRSKTDANARGVRNDRAYILSSCDASLQRLNVSCLDLFYLHRLNPDTPLEESIGALAELVKQGKVRHIGLSEVNADTLERAHRIHPISAVQTEYSLWTRGIESNGVLVTAKRLGIGIVAYSPLGRGFLTGTIKNAEDLEPADFRRALPRFAASNIGDNVNLVTLLEQKAQEKQCTPAQLALAWVLAKGDFIVPIPGTKQIARLHENVGAAKVLLDNEDMAYLDVISQQHAPAQARYAEGAMKIYQLTD